MSHFLDLKFELVVPVLPLSDVFLLGCQFCFVLFSLAIHCFFDLQEAVLIVRDRCSLNRQLAV